MHDLRSGESFKFCREAFNLTQKQMASILCVSPLTVYNIERRPFVSERYQRRFRDWLQRRDEKAQVSPEIGISVRRITLASWREAAVEALPRELRKPAGEISVEYMTAFRHGWTMALDALGRHGYIFITD